MATAQIVLELLPQLDKSKLEGILSSLTTLLSRAGGDVSFIDPAKLKAQISGAVAEIEKMEQDLNSMNLSGLAASFETIFNSPEIQKFTDDIEAAGRAIEDSFSNIDDAGLQKLSGSMAGAFKAGKSGAAEMADTQKNALAQMVISGQKGTDEYKRMVEAMKKAEAESDKYEQALKEVEKELGKVGDAGEKGLNPKPPGNGAFQFNQFSQVLTGVAQSMSEVINVGAEFQSNLAAVGAITGFSGAALDNIGAKARDLAKEFGGSATSQLGSFQGILSKLGPQVAENADALGLLAKNVNTLSAASGDDAATSMNAIVDSMLQLELVSGDAAKDAETSTRVINGLAASAQVGAAEIPQVKDAILASGVAAKGANLSFEALNAGIQVLAVGGKTGSEAGVALRNVLGLLQKASGPAEEAMTKMGTSSKELGELLTTQGLDAALAKLKGGMDGLGTAAEKNAALMTIFGTENSAAAGILLGNIDKFKEFEEGIKAGEQGQGAAFEQAAVRMDTVTAKMSRIKAQVEDAFIGAFQGLGDGITTALGATAQIAPQLTALSGIKQLIPPSAINKVKEGVDLLKGKMGGLTSIAKNLGPSLMNPYVLGTVAAGAALTYFFTQTKAGQKLWKQLEDAAVGLFKKLEPLIMKGADVLGSWFEVIVEIGKIIWEVIITPFEIGVEVIGAIIETLMSLGGEADSTAGALDGIGSVLDGLKLFFNGLRDAAASFGDKLKFGKEVLIAFITGSSDIIAAFGEFATTALNPVNWFDGDLDAAGAKLENALRKTMGKAIDKANNEVAKAKLGEALENAATIKGDLDKNGKVAELVAKFEKAKTDVEKANIAKQIQETVPGAVTAIGAVVDEQGKLITQYSIAKDRIEEYTSAQEKSLNSKAVENAAAISAGLKAQGEEYAALREKSNALLADIVAKSKKGEDTTNLKKRYDETQKELEESAKSLTEKLNKTTELKIPVRDIDIPDSVRTEFAGAITGLEKTASENRIGDLIGKSLDSDTISEAGAKIQTIVDEQLKNVGALQDKALKLQDEIAAKQAQGIDTKELKAQLAAVQADVAQAGNDIAGIVAKSASKGVEITLPDNAKEQFAGELRKAGIEQQLKDVAQIKGNIDANDKLGDLVKKFKAAKTEAEKNSIAAELKKQMPGAVQEMNKGVDANGNLIKTFEVSTEVIEKNVAANKERFSGDIAGKQAEFAKNVEAEGDAYRNNTGELARLAAELNKTKDPAAAKLLQDRFDALQKKVGGSKDKVLELAGGLIDAGGSGEDAIALVSKALGVSDADAKKMVESTRKIGDAGADAAKEVDSLAGAFANAKKAADEAITKGVAAINDNKKALTDALKAGNKEEAARLKEANAQLIADTKKSVAEKKNLEKVEEQTNIQLGLAEAKGESIYAKAKKVFEEKSKTLDLEEKTAEVALSTKLIEEKRERTSFDDLVLQENKLRTLKEQQTQYAKTLDQFVQFNELGQIELKSNVKLKTEEKAEVQSKIADFNLNIQQQVNALQEVKLKINVDEKEVEKQLKELKFQQLQVDVELGLKTNKDITPLLEKEQSAILAQQKDLQAKLKANEEAFHAANNDTLPRNLQADEIQYKARKIQLEKQLIEVQKLEAESASKIRKNLKDIRDKQLEDIDKAQDIETKKTERIIERRTALALAAIQAGTAANGLSQDAEHKDALAAIDKEEKEKLDKLEEWGKLGVMSEQDLALKKEQIAKESQARKEAAEEEHRKRMLVLQKQSEGAEKAVEIAKQKIVLGEQVDGLSKKLQAEKDYVASLKAQGIEDKTADERVAKLSAELDAAKELFDTKGTLLGGLAVELQTTLTDTLSNLFAGNEDAVADSFRSLFATIAGALKAEAAAAVTKMVLNWLNIDPTAAAIPFVIKVGLIPGITAAANLAVNAVLNPVLEGLLSFPTGGRIDQPTLALVGDGARLGESNREWIFRDTQLRQVVLQAANAGNGELISEIRLLRQDIQGFEGRLHFTDTDARNAVRRLDAKLSGRGR